MALLVCAEGLSVWRSQIRGLLVCSWTQESRWIFIAYPPSGESGPGVVVGRTAQPTEPLSDAIFSLLSLQARGDLFADDPKLPRSQRVMDHYLLCFGDDYRAKHYLEGLQRASLDG